MVRCKRRLSMENDEDASGQPSRQCFDYHVAAAKQDRPTDEQSQHTQVHGIANRAVEAANDKVLGQHARHERAAPRQR